MARSTVTSKGQVTIPASTRKAAGLEPGDQVLFLVEGERITLIPVHSRSLTELAGALAPTESEPVLGSDATRAETARAMGQSMAEEMRDWCEHS